MDGSQQTSEDRPYQMLFSQENLVPLILIKQYAALTDHFFEKVLNKTMKPDHKDLLPQELAICAGWYESGSQFAPCWEPESALLSCQK